MSANIPMIAIHRFIFMVLLIDSCCLYRCLFLHIFAFCNYISNVESTMASTLQHGAFSLPAALPPLPYGTSRRQI